MYVTIYMICSGRANV